MEEEGSSEENWSAKKLTEKLKSQDILSVGPYELLKFRWGQFKSGKPVRFTPNRKMSPPTYTLFDRPLGIQPGGLMTDIWFDHIFPFLLISDLFSIMRSCKSFQAAAHRMILRKGTDTNIGLYTTKDIFAYHKLTLKQMRALAIAFGVKIIEANTKLQVLDAIHEEDVNSIDELIYRKQAKDSELEFDAAFYGSRVDRLIEMGFPIYRRPISGRLSLTPNTVDRLVEYLFVDGKRMKRSLGRFINHKTNLVDVSILPAEAAIVKSINRYNYTFSYNGTHSSEKAFRDDSNNHILVKVIRKLFDMKRITLEWIEEFTAPLFVNLEKKDSLFWQLTDDGILVFFKEAPALGDDWMDFTVKTVRVFVKRLDKKRKD